MLSGDDPSALGYVAHGGHGCISVTSNVAPQACAAFFEALMRGDWTAALAGQDRLVRLHKALFLDASPSPTKFARFQRTHGAPGSLRVGDEFVVRMPGPWDGPVRVVDVRRRSFRLATLAGHLEAGQIEFRARPDQESLVFEIESWARSSSPLVNLLYHRLRMAKEVQTHMWVSFLERVVDLSGGRMTLGVEIETERIEPGARQP